MQWLIGTHLVLAILNGSTLSCYLRPIRNLRRGLKLLLTSTGRSELAAGIDLVISILQPLRHFLAGLRAVLWSSDLADPACVAARRLLTSRSS
jgi:hypothetical protein